MSDVDSLDDGQFYEFADDAAFPASGELVPVNYSDVSAMVMPGAPRAYRLRAYRRRRRARQLGCARGGRGGRPSRGIGAALAAASSRQQLAPDRTPRRAPLLAWSGARASRRQRGCGRSAACRVTARLRRADACPIRPPHPAPQSCARICARAARRPPAAVPRWLTGCRSA